MQSLCTLCLHIKEKEGRSSGKGLDIHMRKVQIHYNPYLKSTRLIVDNVEHHDSGKRMDDYIIGKPISEWLTAYSESYYRWNGILPELMEELNDDELEIVFYGFHEHYEQIENAFKTQTLMLEELGFESTYWSLNYKNAYSIDGVKNALSTYISRYILDTPDQQSLMLFEQAENRINQAEYSTVEGLVEIADILHKASSAAISYYQSQQMRNYSMRINSWKNAEKKLCHILEGGAG